MVSTASDQLRLSAQGADKPSSSTAGISRFALQGPLHPGADASGYANCTKSRKEKICNFDETDHVRPPHASSVTQVSGRQNGSLPLRIASEMSRGSELLRANASNSLLLRSEDFIVPRGSSYRGFCQFAATRVIDGSLIFALLSGHGL